MGRADSCAAAILHAEAAGEAASERARLQATVRADRRLREQHAAMLAGLKGAKQQAEADAAARGALQEEVAALQAKARARYLLASGTLISSIFRSYLWVPPVFSFSVADEAVPLQLSGLVMDWPTSRGVILP